MGKQALNETTSKYMLVYVRAIQRLHNLIFTFTWKDVFILLTFIYNPCKGKVCNGQVESTRTCQRKQ